METIRWSQTEAREHLMIDLRCFHRIPEYWIFQLQQSCDQAIRVLF